MPENDFSGAVIQTHAIRTDRFVHVLPRIAIPCVAVECYSVGFCVVAGKMILYNRTRLFLCRSLLHRRDGNRIIRRLCLCLSAPAQNPHKSQRQSCHVPFFHVATSFYQVLSLLLNKNNSVHFRVNTFLYSFAVFRVIERRNRHRTQGITLAVHPNEDWRFHTDS